VAQVLSRYQVASFLDAQVVSFTEVEHRYLRPGRPRLGDPMKKIRRQRLQLVVRRDKEALRREARTDGVFPLLTSLHRLAKREVLEIYKYQPYLEKRFALTKSEYGIAPIFLKKPHRAAALVHMYFVAIMLSALLERQVRAAMKTHGIPELPVLPEARLSPTPTTPRILENFSEVAWYQFQEGTRVVTFPTEINETQKLLLELADVPLHLYR
jgi:transposase